MVNLRHEHAGIVVLSFGDGRSIIRRKHCHSASGTAGETGVAGRHLQTGVRAALRIQLRRKPGLDHCPHIRGHRHLLRQSQQHAHRLLLRHHPSLHRADHRLRGLQVRPLRPACRATRASRSGVSGVSHCVGLIPLVEAVALLPGPGVRLSLPATLPPVQPSRQTPALSLGVAFLGLGGAHFSHDGSAADFVSRHEIAARSGHHKRKCHIASLEFGAIGATTSCGFLSSVRLCFGHLQQAA
jgi:hypothetical protein